MKIQDTRYKIQTEVRQRIGNPRIAAVTSYHGQSTVRRKLKQLDPCKKKRDWVLDWGLGTGRGLDGDWTGDMGLGTGEWGPKIGRRWKWIGRKRRDTMSAARVNVVCAGYFVYLRGRTEVRLLN